eukprot:CAMPEP_0173324638 /NCGR_PEP_ID=MMETSP1144-20121109/34_1 /TAXON_ID=483371 /ORGANISM="non described non described, Strain CCMP2298" /LENGTH=69 /DNA_ID=CAMNT_0014268685 /DNA_START=1272 /DNA_END=1478 /DNA_ORIENTATION=-
MDKRPRAVRVDFEKSMCCSAAGWGMCTEAESVPASGSSSSSGWGMCTEAESVPASGSSSSSGWGMCTEA